MIRSELEALVEDPEGFEQIRFLRDDASGLRAVLVLHDTRCGPAFGGIRRLRYEDLGAAAGDALRLAAHMTLKCAIHGIPGGGGKVVIDDRPGLDRAAAYEIVGDHIAALGGRFYVGPDVGTTADDLAHVARRTGFVALPGPGGPGDLALPTARGVFAGIRAVAGEMGLAPPLPGIEADEPVGEPSGEPSGEAVAADLAGIHVAVQGLGAVGWRVAALLRAAGTRLTVADVRPEAVERAVAEFDAAVAAPDEIHRVDCDVFAPCALGGVVREDRVGELGARAVAGSANNVLASAACARELHRRGVLYAPDFVINSGALLHGAWFHLAQAVPAPGRIDRIGRVLATILRQAAREDRPPLEVALERAKARLAAAPSRIPPSGR